MKKQYYKNDDKSQHKFFNFRTWKRMTEGERSLWTPFNDDPWQEESKLSAEESIKQMNATQKDKSLGNLRLKIGQRIDMMGIDIEVLRWGAKQHLISLSYERKHPGKAKQFGLLERRTMDTSYGQKDILDTIMNYSSFDTLKAAQAAYDGANK